MVNAGAEQKKADINLSKFPIKKTAQKCVLSGNANDENNFDQQPIAPKSETINAEKKFTLDLQPYSMVMITYEL